MAEDLETNLSMYKLQLQQVEDSLWLDPDNEDLLKLKGDLEEVIQLTSDLAGTKPTSSDQSTSEPGAKDETPVEKVPVRNWTPGEKCLALYSEDKCYYEATVDEILEDGSCTVTFEDYGNTDVTEVSLLKPIEEETGKKRTGTGDGGPEAKLSKRDKQAQEREYKRKKSQKKAARRKELEEERETEKNKWINFNAKVFSKTNKGKVKKSIFATPDTVGGKVGVGTCGQSGRPMTKYQSHEKWKK